MKKVSWKGLHLTFLSFFNFVDYCSARDWIKRRDEARKYTDRNIKVSTHKIVVLRPRTREIH